MAIARLNNDLLIELRSSMRKQGDPVRAPQQQAYMKSEMPYHGLTSAETRAICREVFASYDFDDEERWQKDVLDIWRGATKREERYAAIELSQHSTAKKTFYSEMSSVLPMLEEMIVTGAWWDYVDTLASHNVAWVLTSDPKAMKKTMRAWSVDDDMWKRRTSIICQLHVEKVDLDLLYDCIEPSIASKEFFLRKGIGWALRQLAWDDPKEVQRYVKANEDRLSGLSIREALKNIPGGVATSSPKRATKRKTASVAPRTPSRARRGSS